jgi:ribosomal protein L32
MKPPKSPAYTERREYTPRHAVPGFGMCPSCGKFATAYCSHQTDGVRIQHRACSCGNRFKTVISGS